MRENKKYKKQRQIYADFMAQKPSSLWMTGEAIVISVEEYQRRKGLESRGEDPGPIDGKIWREPQRSGKRARYRYGKNKFVGTAAHPPRDAQGEENRRIWERGLE